MDTLNGNETVYGSIREAAVAIGCVHVTIINALKKFKETGETRLIKKRFKVKHIQRGRCSLATNCIAVRKKLESLDLLKNGYSNFSLEILEYCEPSEAVVREQYYLDLLHPQYNILKFSGSLRGFKHSEETKAKLSAAIQGRTHTEETIAKM